MVPDIRKPLGPHQALQVSLNFVLIERLADLAQELGLDLVRSDCGSNRSWKSSLPGTFSTAASVTVIDPTKSRTAVVSETERRERSSRT